MSPRLGYPDAKPTPPPAPPAKFVDKPPKSLGGLAARALAVMETNGPARRRHNDVLKANTGWYIDPVKWAKRATASRLLAEQSASIADALERMGVPARLDSDITAIGAVTGQVESLAVYRAINHRAGDEDGEEQDTSGDTNPSSSSSGKETSGSTESKPGNLMLGVSLPQWRHTPWAEPLILVQRYDPTAMGTGDLARLEDIDIEKRLARDDWDNGGGPAPEIALDVAAKALAGTLSERDAVFAEMKGNLHRMDPMEGGEAELYRVHTCRPTVPAAPVGTGTRTDAAAEPPASWQSWRPKLPPPDREDDLIPFDPPPSAFVSAMRAEHGCVSPAMAA